MARTKTKRTRADGIVIRGEVYHIEKTYLGVRISGTTKIKVGRGSLAEAEAILEKRKSDIRALQLHGSRPARPFIDACEEYCYRNQTLDGIDGIIKMLDRICISYLGAVALKDIHNDHPMVKKLRADLLAGSTPWDPGNGQDITKPRPRKRKTVNVYLDLISRILRAAAYSWRDESGNTWLQSAPRFQKEKIELDARQPKPITWDQQDLILGELPAHLQRVALYCVNSGLRDREILALRTSWKVNVKGMEDVYVLPGYWTDEVTGELFKVTKNGQPRVHVPNKICRSILEECARLADPDQPRPVVFSYRGKPITRVVNTSWKKARARAGMLDPYLLDLRFHDLRHTFGHRLRDAGINETDRETLLGHASGSITDHYSQADVNQLKTQVEKITDRSNAVPVLSVASIFKR